MTIGNIPGYQRHEFPINPQYYHTFTLPVHGALFFAGNCTLDGHYRVRRILGMAKVTYNLVAPDGSYLAPEGSNMAYFHYSQVSPGPYTFVFYNHSPYNIETVVLVVRGYCLIPIG